MKHARIQFNGSELEVTVENNGQLKSKIDDRLIDPAEVEWLCPVKNPGTIFALGLNYADHARELSFEPPKEPLVFLKGTNTLTGHKQNAYRPDNIEFQHYECELVAVIGKEGKYIPREQAMDYVSGYTVCNDFAIRDYLENYYRPNLRVKSRDALMPIGPYIIDKEDVGDISNLTLTTHVNGELTQKGSTKDIIFDVPFLVAYLSNIMTLKPGDMIATGTPEGLKDMQPGDTVVCEIEKIGRLETSIVSEKDFYGDKY